MASMGFSEGDFAQDAARIKLLKESKELEELQAAATSCGEYLSLGAKPRAALHARTEGLFDAMQRQRKVSAESNRARSV